MLDNRPTRQEIVKALDKRLDAVELLHGKKRKDQLGDDFLIRSNNEAFVIENVIDLVGNGGMYRIQRGIIYTMRGSCAIPINKKLKYVEYSTNVKSK